MGMDMYLVRARTKKQIEQPDFWTECVDMQDQDAWENDEFKTPAMLWYARKFWDLLHEVFPDYDCGEWVEVSKNQLREMIKYATEHTDYWGGFNSVPALCQALASYDEAREHGFNYFMESDW